MKNAAKYVLGFAMVIVALLWMLDILNLVNVTFLFKGWWTLFIIVPCSVALFTERDKAGPLVGIAVGVLLLLSVRDVINWDMFWKLLLACIVLVMGLAILFGNSIKNRMISEKERCDIEKIQREGRNIRVFTVSFGEKHLNMDGELFEGADVKVSFASFTLDLRNAIFQQDSVLRVDCNFAGMELLLPSNISVKVTANAAFGGIEDKRRVVLSENAPVLYIEGNCSFAGLDIL